MHAKMAHVWIEDVALYLTICRRYHRDDDDQDGDDDKDDKDEDHDNNVCCGQGLWPPLNHALSQQNPSSCEILTTRLNQE